MTASFAATSRRRSLRALGLVGSALGSTLIIQPAAAQNQTFTGPTNQTVPGTVNGGPTTISATTSTGDIVLTVDTVVANNTGSGTAAPGTNAAVYAFNSGTGNTTVNDVNATITGSGASNGIFAAAQGGTVTINQTGAVDATNAINGRGITAASNGGTIVINANEADGGLRGVFTGSTGATAGSTGNLAASTTINVTTATATGAGNTPNAIVAQGESVVLNSGTASLTNTAGTNGTAILVNAGTSATVTSGTANAFGQGQAAILAAADGVLNLTSGSVRATQNSDGISIQGGTPGETITVKSGTILLDGANSGYGLVLGGNHGGNFSSGANGLAYGSATVTSDTITTAGANSYAIYATPNGAGTTAITSNNITTMGAGSTGILVAPIGTGTSSGDTTIANTGTLKTSNATGIQVTGGTGAATINNTGTVNVGGDQNNAINVIGTTGAVNVVGKGSSTASGDNGHAIAVSTSTGAITIDAGTSSTTGSYNQNIGGNSADAISTSTTGAAPITIRSGNASSASLYGSAIYAVTNTSSVTFGGGNGPIPVAGGTIGTIVINSGVATTTGSGGTAIAGIAYSGGDVTIAATTTMAQGQGIGANAKTGNATVNAGTVTAAGGFGINAIAGQGLATVTATTANGATNGYNGVLATGTTGVALTIGSAASTGATTMVTSTNSRTGAMATTTKRADAVYASTTGGAINATVNSATATGMLAATTTTSTATGTTSTAYTSADGVRLLATGTNGAVTLVGTGTLSSQSGYGLYVNTLNADLTAGTVNSSGVNLAALEVDLTAPTGTATSAKITTAAVNATGAGSRGIYVTGPAGSTATISGGAVTTAGGNGIDIGSGFGSSTIASASVAGAAIGINAQNIAGALTINSGTIASPTTTLANGATAYGINASTATNSIGALAITSGTITGNAANPTYGIFALGFGSGSVSVTSGSISSFVNDGIYAQSNTGAVSVASTGSITASSVNGSSGSNGIEVFSTSGPITITSANVATSGNGSMGVRATAGSGGTPSTAAINITSTGTLTTTGGNAYGISAYGGGPISITNSGTISTQTQTSDGINITPSTGSGPITVVNSGTINAGGAGIFIPANASNVTRTISITSNAIASANSMGISASGGTGAISINSTGPIVTGGAGTYGYGIQANGTGAITIAAGSVQTNGQSATAIQVNAGAGDTSAVSVQAGTLQATAGGVNVVANGNGTTSPIAVTVTNAMTVGSAVTVAGNAAVNVTTGTIRVAGGAATAIIAQSAGGLVTVNSTDLGVANGGGIFASGATGANITSGKLAGTGTSNGFGLIAQVSTPAQGSTIVPTGVSVDSTALSSVGGGIRTSSLTANTTINSSSVTTSGTNLAAIYAAATTGNLAITSGSLNASGTSGNGISANTTNGNIVINSTSAITTGAYLASTNNSPDAITAFTSATGPGTVTINSGTASAIGDVASAIFGYGGGNVTITSGTATTAGNGTGGTIVAIGANSRLGDTSVTATTTTATGTNSSAVSVTSAVGNATAALGTASAINGQALTVNAGKLASVTAATLSSGGDGFAGVFAQGGTGVTLNVGSASSSGTLTTTTNTTTGVTTTRRADAIYATATAGTIDATIGSAKATGAGADAVRLIANGTGGAVTARITGTLSSTSGYGLFIDPPGANTVTVASGASISGATGVSLTGASNAITNAGSITGTAGAGIIASGATTLDNSGGIAGTGGVAVQLGATNDAVTLRTGSAVTGAIVGGGGTDTATLIGTSNAATTSEQAAAFTGFDRLTVQSGYWTASAANPTVLATSATINGGASLDIANGAAGLTLTAPSIVDNGTLVVRGSSASAGSTFGTSVVTGSGNALLTGGLVTLDRDNSLQNTGVTTIDTGTTVLLTAAQVGNFINNGMVQIGNGGTTGLFTGTLADNGTVVSNRSDSYTFTGALTGTGTFVKNGAGTVTFGTNYAFTGVTQLNGGGVKLSTVVAPTTKLDAEGTGTYDLSGVNQTIAQLSGASTGATINITNDALTVNQDTTTSFAGSITGNGSLTKTGTGSLNLTGTNTYTGTTTVNGGRLAVNGSITSPVTVNSGGTLGGNGTVGNTVIGSGGTFAPGNSIGTTNVAGNLTFQAGSNYQVEANAAGMADRVNASGTITINGGTVQVLAAPGTYNPITQYTILTAAGGISGQFAGVTSSLAFLSPLLTYSTNAVTLGLYRNDINFASMAASPNGAAVAAAIASRGFGNALYNAVLVQTATGAPVAFNQLSGEIHATIPSVLIDSDRRVRDAVLDHNHGTLRPGLGLWLQSLGTTAHSRSQGALANFNTTRLGLVGGVDYGLGDFRIGLNGGYFSDRLRNPNVFSRAQIGTELIGGSIGWLPEGGRLSAQGGITHARHHVDTTRTVTVTGLAGSYQSVSTARTTQAFGEISFALIDGPVAVTPFARYAHDWERGDSFNETGGLATLSVARERRSNDFGSAGVRLSGSRPIANGLAIEPNMSLGYLHSWGRLYSVRSETISGAAFSITGDLLGRDNLDANGGVDLVVKGQLRLGVSGYLTRSSQWRDYGGKASVSFRF